MTIFEHIDAGASIQDLENLSYQLYVDTDAQRLAIRILQLHSVAESIDQADLADFIRIARVYVQNLSPLRIVKRNLMLVDKNAAGAEIPVEEQFVYERTSDMVQLFRWARGLSQEDLYFVMQTATEVTTQVSGQPDIIKVINTALAIHAKEPMTEHARRVCQVWLRNTWASPDRSTLRLEWPRKALDSLFGY